MIMPAPLPPLPTEDLDHVLVHTRDLWRAAHGASLFITGGSGYLASNLVLALSAIGCSIDLLSRSDDLWSQKTWERAVEGVDAVFHFAAQTSVPVAERDPEADYHSNVLPMLLLLEACRRMGRRPVVLFAGTVTQAGLTRSIPVNEANPDHPITIYDLHKLFAEAYLKRYVEAGVVNGACLRLANVFGPGPKSSSADRGVLNMMVRKALAGETLTIYGSGERIRDYVFVDDVVSAFLHAAARMDRVNGRHFVIGSGQGRSIAEAVEAVAERASLRIGRRPPVVHREPPSPPSPIEDRDFIADTTAFRRATGWLPQVGFLDGLDRTLEHAAQGSAIA